MKIQLNQIAEFADRALQVATQVEGVVKTVTQDPDKEQLLLQVPKDQPQLVDRLATYVGLENGTQTELDWFKARYPHMPEDVVGGMVEVNNLIEKAFEAIADGKMDEVEMLELGAKLIRPLKRAYNAVTKG